METRAGDHLLIPDEPQPAACSSESDAYVEAHPGGSNAATVQLHCQKVASCTTRTPAADKQQ